MQKKILGFLGMLILVAFLCNASNVTTQGGSITLNPGKNTMMKASGDTLNVDCIGDTIVNPDTLWTQVYKWGNHGTTWYMAVEVLTLNGEQDISVLAQWGMDPTNLNQYEELFNIDDRSADSTYAVDSVKAITPDGVCVRFGLALVSDANDSCRVNQWQLWTNYLK